MGTVRWLAVVLVAAGSATATATVAQAAGPARCDGRVATIVGTAGEDRIAGTSGPDVILAGGGRDSVDGRGGDDRICGGPGADVIVGGPGDDRLFGEGNQFHADPGGVHVLGDVLDGGAGDDVLDVGRPTPYADSLAGERVEFLTAPGAVSVDLAAGTSTGQGDDVMRVRRDMSVRTGDGDDTILGTRWGDKVDAGLGNDTVRLVRGQDTFVEHRRSLPDNDVVDTGAGADRVVVVSGADVVSTGVGQDDVTATGRGPHALETGAGADLVVARATDAPGSLYDLGSGVGDELSLDVGVRRGDPAVPIRIDVPAGLLTLTRPVGPVVAEIHGIEDFVLGKEFRIDFLGGDADETLFLAPVGSIPVHALMGGGDDRVWGSRGDDHLDGGAGVDTAYGDEGDDTCIGIEHPTDC